MALLTNSFQDHKKPLPNKRRKKHPNPTPSPSSAQSSWDHIKNLITCKQVLCLSLNFISFYSISFSSTMFFISRLRFLEFKSRENGRRPTRSWDLLVALYVALEMWFMAMLKWFIGPITPRKAAPSDRKLGYLLGNLQTVLLLVL